MKGGVSITMEKDEEKHMEVIKRYSQNDTNGLSFKEILPVHGMAIVGIANESIMP